MSAKPAEKDVLGKLGFELIPPDQALAALDAADAAGRPLSLIADMDWQKFQVFIDFCPQPSAFANVATCTESEVSKSTDRIQKILTASDQEARALIERAVRLELKSVTLIESADRIDADQRFNFMGMDSLMALSLAAALETYFQFDVPNTLTYNHPTIRAVSDYIFTQLRGVEPAAEAVPAPGNQAPTSGSWLLALNRKGCNPPKGPPNQPIHDLPDDAFLAEVLDKYDSDQDPASRTKALMRTVDLLRADLTLFETYRPSDRRITPPIGAICALDDPLVSEAAMRDWADRTTGGFHLYTVGGGHHMVTDRPVDVSGAVLKFIAQMDAKGT